MRDELKALIKDRGKNFFLGLSCLSLLVYWFFGFFLTWFISPGLKQIHSVAPVVFALITLSFLVVLTGGFILILISVYGGVDLLYPHRSRQVTITFLFPLNVLLGKLLGIGKDRIRLSYISLNNAIWTVQEKRLNGSKILILLPHCLQLYDCPFKITHKIENCKRCGRCVIGDISKLADKYDLFVSVATGGTLARKVVVDYRPTFIIAVACERDLSLGIQEVYPIPVYGVLNERPNGPCVNTIVDIDKLENIIKLVKHAFAKSE